MRQLTEVKVLVIKWLANMKFIYKQDKQGLYYIDRALLITMVALMGLALGLASYYSWQVKQKHQLTQQIAQLKIKNANLEKSKVTHAAQNHVNQTNIQSIIGYLAAEGFTVQNMSSNQDHDKRIWKAEGILNKVQLTSFVSHIDQNKQLLQVNSFSIEQIDDSPEQLKISLSSTLR